MAEKKLKKGEGSAALGYAWEAGWRHKELFVLPLIFICIVEAIGVLTQYGSKWIVAAALARNHDDLVRAVVTLFMLEVLYVVADNRMWWFVFNRVTHALQRRVKGELIGAVTGKDMNFFQKYASDVVSYRINSVWQIIAIWQDFLLNFSRNFVSATISIVIIASYIPWALIPITVGIVGFSFLFWLHDNSMLPLREKARRQDEELNDNAVIRMFASAIDLMSSASLNKHMSRVLLGLDVYIESANQLWKKEVGWLGQVRNLSSGVIRIVLFYMIGLALLRGEQNSESFVALTAVIGNLFNAMWNIAEFAKDISRKLPRLVKIREMHFEAIKYRLPEKPVVLQDQILEFELQNVEFTYEGRNVVANDEDEEDLLDDGTKTSAENLRIRLGLDKVERNEEITTLNVPYLRIKKGERVAIVGPSGSGKSTLVKLLLGFYYPDDGKVLLNGVKTQDIGFVEICRMIGVISQDINVMDANIAENILREAAPYTQEQEDIVVEALKLSGLWEEVQHWPENIYTRVGSRGVRLSGGQRQMLSLARMIITHALNLILDEATSALDMTTEARFNAAVRQMSSGTQIVIAHRLDSIRDADRIIVMDKGSIVEDGTHETLLEKGGLYFRLWNKLTDLD